MNMHVTTTNGRETIFPKTDDRNAQFQAMRMDHFPASVPIAHSIEPLKIGLWNITMTEKWADVEWK